MIQKNFWGFLVIGHFAFLSSCSLMESKKTEYTFFGDYFQSREPIWSHELKEFAVTGKGHYLEIGVRDGHAATWVASHLFLDAGSSITGIDIEGGAMKKAFFHNLQVANFKGKARFLEGKSQKLLNSIPDEQMDLIYIDGSHTRRDVLNDATLAWNKLKTNGIMIFDDYDLEFESGDDLKPQKAIDDFIASYQREISVNKKLVITKYPDGRPKSSQMMLRKRLDLCDQDVFMKYRCTEFGSYRFFWKDSSYLYDQGGKKIILKPVEETWVKQILFAGLKGDGPTHYQVPSKIFRLPEFLTFMTRLQIPIDENGKIYLY